MNAATSVAYWLTVSGTTDRRGTEVHFMASVQTFGRVEFHYEILARRIRELFAAAWPAAPGATSVPEPATPQTTTTPEDEPS